MTDGSNENKEGEPQSPAAIIDHLPDHRNGASDEISARCLSWGLNLPIPVFQQGGERIDRRNSANESSVGETIIDGCVSKHSRTETSDSAKSSLPEFEVKSDQVEMTKRLSDTASVVTTDYQTRKSMWSRCVNPTALLCPCSFNP